MANPNTLSTQFNIVVNEGNNPSEFKNDARKNNRGRGRGANYRGIHEINFTSVAKLGLGIRQVRMANELVGAYTGDRLTQRQVETGLTFAQYGVGLVVAGPIGIAYAFGDMAYRTANYEIKRTRENQIARYIKDLSGNNARNQSRSRGDKL
jgi:hypothetical protein